jgi:glyoxylate carboligase
VAEIASGKAVIELLKAEQVKHIFGIVGSTFLDVLDVLYDDKSVEYINVRHEQGAAFMADWRHRHPGGLPGYQRAGCNEPAHGHRVGLRGVPPVVISGGPAFGNYYKDAFQSLTGQHVQAVPSCRCR